LPPSTPPERNAASGLTQSGSTPLSLSCQASHLCQTAVQESMPQASESLSCQCPDSPRSGTWAALERASGGLGTVTPWSAVREMKLLGQLRGTSSFCEVRGISRTALLRRRIPRERRNRWTIRRSPTGSVPRTAANCWRRSGPAPREEVRREAPRSLADSDRPGGAGSGESASQEGAERGCWRSDGRISREGGAGGLRSPANHDRPPAGHAAPTRSDRWERLRSCPRPPILGASPAGMSWRRRSPSRMS